MYRKQKLPYVIYLITLLLFALFFVFPLITLLSKSFHNTDSMDFSNYQLLFTDTTIVKAIIRSFKVSFLASLIATALAFIIAYTINITNISRTLKNFLAVATSLPMLLPTITYGFAIIYSFGKEGLLTKLLHHQIIQIYGFNGLILGYVIYTLPISFVLIHNAFQYID